MSALQKQGKLLVVCAPTSSGKSLFSTLLSKKELNFVKLNTKSQDLKTRVDVSKKYFRKELEEASSITGSHFQTVMDLFTFNSIKKDSRLNAICKKIRKIEDGLPLDYSYDILYANYSRAIFKILHSGQNCVLDHNFFLDPYPLRKDQFNKHFSPIRHRMRVLHLYNLPENTFLNLIQRNRRFESFVETSMKEGIEMEKSVSDVSIKKGFSEVNFRQPVRLLENWASMYSISTEKTPHEVVHDQLPIQNGLDLLLLAEHYQERLVGLLFACSYPAPHLSVSNGFFNSFSKLITPRKGEVFLYIQGKKFEYDLFFSHDNNLRDEAIVEKLLQLIQKWPVGPVADSIKVDGVARTKKLEELLQEVKKNQEFTLPKNLFEIACSECPNHVVLQLKSFKSNSEVNQAIEEAVSLVEQGVEKSILVFPTGADEPSCLEFSLQEKDLHIVLFCSSANKLTDFSNNLTILGKTILLLAKRENVQIKRWTFSGFHSQDSLGFNTKFMNLKR